jgi:Predicted xylanase/chitin deacetylase
MFHLGSATILMAQPECWPVIGAVLAANQLVLIGAGMWPRSWLLGPNIVKLPEHAVLRKQIALTFDDGPDPTVTSCVLDLLDRYAAKASFFCIGKKAQAYSEIVREIAARGHDLENHTYSHSNAFACFRLAALQRELETTQDILVRITGRVPSFFRAPAGIRSPLLDLALARSGLRYVSWTRRGYDTVTRDPERVVRRLLKGLSAGDVLLLHDGAATRCQNARQVVLEVLPRLLDHLTHRGLVPVTLQSAIDAAAQ